MSVEKLIRPDGSTRWTVRWREAGRNRRRTFTRKDVADKFDRKMKDMKAAGGLDVFIAGEQTLTQWFQVWWEQHAKRKLSPRTKDVYAVQLDQRILPVLGAYQLRHITPALVRDFDARMEREGVGRATRVKALTVLQSMLQLAVVDGVIRMNPVQAIRKPSQRREREPVLISPAQVEAIRRLMLAGGWDRPSQRDPKKTVKARPDLRSAMIVSLLAYSGLRPESEGVTLTWSRVRARSIFVPPSLKRGGRERSVRLLEPLAEDLREWRRVQPGTDLVFPTAKGGPWSDEDWKNWQARVFKHAARAAGLPEHVRARDLRGSFATLLIFEGRNIAEVSRQLGHSPQVALRDYISIIDEFDPTNPVPAEEQIRRAREQV